MLRFFAWIWKNKLLSLGIVIVMAAVFTALFAPIIAPFDPTESVPSERLSKPFSEGHLLGADFIGRDLLSRIMYGLRTSLLISVGSVLIALVVGVVVGIISGFSNPGIGDTVLMRITDVQMGFPFIVLAMIALSLVDPTPLSVMVVLSLASWPAYARATRTLVMMQKDTDYVAAAKIMGASKLRIATKYIGKNLLPAIIPTLPLDIAAMIINESLLSFMQLGIRSPIISLGNIMADGKTYIATDWWITGIPGIIIMVVVLGLNFIGDNLQAKLDPGAK